MNDLFGKTIDPRYKGKHMEVRVIHKRDGRKAWGIHRPGSSHSILDQFSTIKEANIIAEFIDHIGGSYAQPYRGEAKLIAKLFMEADGKLIKQDKHLEEIIRLILKSTNRLKKLEKLTTDPEMKMIVAGKLSVLYAVLDALRDGDLRMLTQEALGTLITPEE